MSASDQSVASPFPLIQWEDEGEIRSAYWRSESAARPPRRIVPVDDTLTADSAFRHASEGSGLLWHGDFHNARQLLKAMTRRLDDAAAARSRKASRRQAGKPPGTGADFFNRVRMNRGQRARTLGMLLIPVELDHQIRLRRAPDLREALHDTWGAPIADPAGPVDGIVVSLRELLGIASAHEWHLKGVEVPALGGPYNRIHPRYGVFSPVRGEYIDLVAAAPLPESPDPAFTAFDIGTGTGVLAALLARRGVARVIATDNDPRAIQCARENIARLGLNERVSIEQTSLFPDGRASLIVCNPPWLAARPSTPLEASIYDQDGAMLSGFLRGLASHLAPGGQAWLLLSDIAERLGLRTREDLLAMFSAAGLKATGRANARPAHPKVSDQSDPLHEARAAEITSLWRLEPA